MIQRAVESLRCCCLRFDDCPGKVTWPAELQRLTFGHNFNRPLGGVVWPPRLQRLVMGTNFNQTIADVVWPKGLQELVFGEMFDQASIRKFQASCASSHTLRLRSPLPERNSSYRSCLRLFLAGTAVFEPLVPYLVSVVDRTSKQGNLKGSSHF